MGVISLGFRAARSSLRSRGTSSHRSRPVALLVLSLMLVPLAWLFSALPASAQVAPVPTPTPNCAVGTSNCQQGLLLINKSTGAVTSRVLIPGDNTENQHNDGLECHGPTSGKCWLAFGSNGLGVLDVANASGCSPSASANVSAVDTAGNGARFDAIALDQANGTLYGTKGTQFGSINTSSGAFTAIGSGLGGSIPSGSVGDSNDLVLALAWDAGAGNFLASVDQGHGNGASLLVRINPSTGTVVSGAFGSNDYLAVKADGGRGEVSGLVYEGSTLYAATSAADTGGHLEKLDPSAGTLTDIGVLGVDIPKVRSLTADSSGQLYGLTGTAGADVGPLPCPSPTPSPSPTPPPASPTPPPPSPVPSPALSVAPAQFTNPSPSPSTTVLGVQFNKEPTLPVTGTNLLPLIVAALFCYFLGAFILMAASKQTPRFVTASVAAVRRLSSGKDHPRQVAREFLSEMKSWFVETHHHDD